MLAKGWADKVFDLEGQGERHDDPLETEKDAKVCNDWSSCFAQSLFMDFYRIPMLVIPIGAILWEVRCSKAVAIPKALPSCTEK